MPCVESSQATAACGLEVMFILCQNIQRTTNSIQTVNRWGDELYPGGCKGDHTVHRLIQSALTSACPHNEQTSLGSR